MSLEYVPPFDFSKLAANQTAKWNSATQEWEVYSIPEPLPPPDYGETDV